MTQKHPTTHMLPAPRSWKATLTLLLLGLWMPLAISAGIKVYISSASDWNHHCHTVKKDFEYDVIFNADITLTAADSLIEDCVGTINGQGHTITLNTSGKDWALIGQVSAGKTVTVQSLRFKGTQKVEQGTISYKEESPLVRKVYGTLNVELCQTDVEFTVSGTSGNYCYVGGFVSQVYKGGTVNFTNCSSMVKFVTTDGQDMGGFVGRVDEGGKVTATNCHSLVKFSEFFGYVNGSEHWKYQSYSKDDIGCFVGELKGELVCSNSYTRFFSLRDDSQTPQYYRDPTEKDNTKVSGNIIEYSIDSGKSGETTYNLNQKSSAADVPWVQDIGTDEIPLLWVFNPSKGIVYYLEPNTVKGSGHALRTLYYPTAVRLSTPKSAYTVTGEKNGRLTLTPVKYPTTDSTFSAQPVIIYDEDVANTTVTHNSAYYNQSAAPTGDCLKGVFSKRTLHSGEYILDPTQMKFVKVEKGAEETEEEAKEADEETEEFQSIDQWECFLSGEDFTADSYVVPLGPVPCELSATSVELQQPATGTVVAGTPTVKGLPSDFDGTITYTSSNPDICTVDADGTVTYKGTSEAAPEVTITVTMPAFETWKSRTLTYTITFRSGETVSIPKQYSTFCSTHALDFAGNEDVEAYTAQINQDGTAVILTRVDKVPAGAGLVLKKIGDNTTATVSIIASADELTDNQMVGVTADNTVGVEALIAANAYILSGQQFRKVASGASGYMAAGKAYLAAPANTSAKSLTIDFDTTTGVAIVETNEEKAINVYYNLQGVRVAKPTAPGLYIVNGKKVLIKK